MLSASHKVSKNRRYIVLRVVLFVLLTVLSSSCSAQSISSAKKAAIPLTRCTLSLPSAPNQIDAKCGTLIVPENPSIPDGRLINLNIAVVPAISRKAEPDPLFVLAGGPGQSIIEIFPAIYPILFRLHQTRDIVLVDQRGTGQSNPLHCLNANDKFLNNDETIALLQSCPEKLDADLKYYTTDIAMKDLDQVRSVLGYSTINLYGTSYGTRAALTYLKMYPDQVRSIILDAVVDPTFVLYKDTTQDGQQALNILLSRCEQNADCSSAYPNLKNELDVVLHDLDKNPIDITIPHPTTGQPIEISLTKELFTNTIFNSLYSPDFAALLPLSIHQAYTEDNFAPLITQSYAIDANIYDGMFYAVTCTEDAPFISSNQSDQNKGSSIFVDGSKDFVEVCKTWPKGDLFPELRTPVSSDIPTLILSGEADPVTPPWHADLLAQTLPNSLHLIFNGMGHGNLTNECAIKILGKFIDNASIERLDTSCVEDVIPPPFFVDFSGPRP
ncbi:MAG: alpha/beta hydrolase [Anaerolineae bacterium]|jgi:pimeloyl-ACP methyl ester carboxylesterase|nr:alpha/beta hydrolase [Anaerolineae bacterium]MBT7190919.1 alpha/beta hydrolase [Anaerolineae bacterium]MBT7715542.1 alpha/beta hydrolase [Deltaproteobacteria bacterium]